MEALAPTLATIRIARQILDAVRVDGCPDAVAEYLPLVARDQQLALLAYMTNLAAKAQPERGQRLTYRSSAQREREEAAYTDTAARQAHNAYVRGVDDDYTRTGERVYQRRVQRARREKRAGLVA